MALDLFLNSAKKYFTHNSYQVIHTEIFLATFDTNHFLMNKIFTTLVLAITTLNVFAQNPSPCSELFFSEYIEGNSFNKVIEIYNPSSVSKDLSNYKLLLFSNGNDTANATVTLSGILPSTETFVVCHPQADSIVLTMADYNSPVINFNGNDAFALYNIITGDTIDRIGVIGFDPGITGWTVDTGYTQNNTLVRKASVNNGQFDWMIGATEWDVFPINDFSHLGSHTMTPCALVPEVYLISATQSAGESSVAVIIQIGINNANASATSVTLTVSDINATLGTDYDLTGNPVTVTFPASSNANQTVGITIISDAVPEPDETFNITLSNPTNGATILTSQEVVTINDDDSGTSPAFYFLFSSDSVGETITNYSADLEFMFGSLTTSPSSIDVSLVTAQSTATENVDFTFSDTTITWGAADGSSKFAIFHLIDDLINEATEHFVLTLSNPTNGAVIGTNGSTQINIKDNDPVGTQNLFTLSNSVLVPNPATDKTILLTNGRYDYYSISDATGRIIRAEEIRNESAVAISLSELSSGIYFISLHGNENTEVLKLMKQ